MISVSVALYELCVQATASILPALVSELFASSCTSPNSLHSLHHFDAHEHFHQTRILLLIYSCGPSKPSGCGLWPGNLRVHRIPVINSTLFRQFLLLLVVLLNRMHDNAFG